jgi:acetolactate synthase-1/2/3 large subunit
MGAGICAAIGVKKAKPGATVIALFGDGSMRMHGMELVTAKRYNLAIIFILCDNESYASTPGNNELKKLPIIRWNEFAASLDIKSFYIDNKADFNQHLTSAYSAPW